MNQTVTKWVAGAAVGLLCWTHGSRAGLAVALAQTAPTQPAGGTQPARGAATTPATSGSAAPAPQGTPSPTPTPASGETPAEGAQPAEGAAQPAEPPPAEVPAAPAPAPEPAATPMPMPEPEPAKPRSMLPVFITGGLSVVAAAVGTGFAIDAASQTSAFNDNPTGEKATSAEVSALGADIAFGASALLGVTALALLFIQDDAKPAAPAAKAAPAGAPQHAGAAKQKVQWIATPVALPHGGGGGVFVKF